eukprot:scaffold129396_cov36-Tisochrysis_lutea.AAC.3
MELFELVRDVACNLSLNLRFTVHRLIPPPQHLEDLRHQRVPAHRPLCGSDSQHQEPGIMVAWLCSDAPQVEPWTMGMFDGESASRPSIDNEPYALTSAPRRAAIYQPVHIG